jgi:hypothetical protein
MFDQLISMAGAVLVLAAYALLQKGRMTAKEPLYSWMNFVGAGLLTVVAIRDQRLGFIVLEGAWALLSAWPLLKRIPNAE